MNGSNFLICAIPHPVWAESDNEYGIDIARIVRRALACERRIAKGVNLEVEYRRYSLACQRLEQEVALSGKVRLIEKGISEFHSFLQQRVIPALSLGRSHLDLLYRLREQRHLERVGASYFLPDMVKAHRLAYQLWAAQLGQAGKSAVERYLGFLESAEREGCGVVELQTCFHPLSLGADEGVPSSSLSSSRDAGYLEPRIPGLAFEEKASAKTGRAPYLANVLRDDIRKALETGEPVAFTGQIPGDVITETLNELVFVSAGDKVQPSEMRIVYKDGSEAAPFPLFCLPRLPSPEQDRSSVSIVRVGLVSMRHLDLDRKVDFYWFSNREVMRTGTLAEADQLCFNSTLLQLISADLGEVRIRLYQTGFLPAILGFYRGLVRSLMVLPSEKQRVVTIEPRYWHGGEIYEPGAEWR